jgi:branched-chain amino acid transport system ATP-binding protein
MSAALVAVTDVSKRFEGLVAVDRMSFTLERGEICGLIGPNGAGKSTLFGVIAGAVVPTAGNVTLDGRDITGAGSDAVARLGIARAFQLVNLFGSMTVRDNVLAGAENGRLFPRRAARRRARDDAWWALELVGIADLAAAPVDALTYGQQRLVATARALASRPKVLLLDEPAAGLSEVEVERLCDSIRRARNAGISILIVEHNVPLVMRLCDRVIVMQNGAKIADGPALDVQRSDVVAEAYLGR